MNIILTYTVTILMSLTIISSFIRTKQFGNSHTKKPKIIDYILFVCSAIITLILVIDLIYKFHREGMSSIININLIMPLVSLRNVIIYVLILFFDQKN